jgi:CRISPR-associated protein Csy1
VGSHCLGNDFASDVVGNAAALDVYKFLKLEHRGVSLLTLSIARDANFAAALSSDVLQAQAWMTAFASLAERRGRAASHTLAKQLYWLTGEDPHDDGCFHLLAPLYATSLAHRVYQTVQEDRFSEEAKAARQARKEGEYSVRPVREYPQMAIQKLGGTKPQNISQLNSERRGENLLFASLPPMWRSIDVKPLLGTESMFTRFSRRAEVRQLVKALLAFLKSDPLRNVETRKRRAELVDGIIDEFLQFSAELRFLPSGWSQAPECRLSSPEKYWLDRKGIERTPASEGLPLPTDNAERMSALFANWLNAQLRDPLPMGDPEFLEWRNRMYEEIKAEEREGRHDD